MLKIMVTLDEQIAHTEVESDVVSPDEMIIAGSAAIKVVSRSVLEKLNKRERKAFLNTIFKFFKALEKGVK